jgi:septum formation protein
MPAERPTVYLASRSPRRRELLAQAGIRFEPVEADVDESAQPGETPAAYVLRLALAKAEAGWRRLIERDLPRAPVLAADTAIALDGRIYGKPSDRREAEAMLAALSGRRHEVLTAVALKHGERIETALSSSEVHFRELTAAEIRDYVRTGEADDKAGAYAIQGRAAGFVAGYRGSHSGIVGLPLEETARLIARLQPHHGGRDPD